MELLNFVVVYLACGAPVGVHFLTHRETIVRKERYLTALTAFVLWPYFSIRLLLDQKSRINVIDDRRSKIERFRTDIEDLAFRGSQTKDLFDFREIFYRYTSLALANSDETVLPSEVFQVTSHPLPAIGARCLSRRNRQKIENNLSLTRNELVSTINELDLMGPSKEKICAAARSLTEIVGDVDGTSSFNQLTYNLQLEKN